MNHYLFSEDVTGEEFIVGSDTRTEAIAAAKDIAAAIVENYGYEHYILTYHGRLSDEEAEASGLDEY